MVKSGKSGQKQAKVVGSSKSGLNSQKWFFRKKGSQCSAKTKDFSEIKKIFSREIMFCLFFLFHIHFRNGTMEELVQNWTSTTTWTTKSAKSPINSSIRAVYLSQFNFV